MNKISLLLSLILVVVSISCQIENPGLQSLVDNGNFSEAKSRINQTITKGSISEKERYDMESKIALMKRIEKDFSKTADDVLEYLRKYYSNISKNDLTKWEKSGALEYKIINGEKNILIVQLQIFLELIRKHKRLKLKLPVSRRTNCIIFLRNI